MKNLRFFILTLLLFLLYSVRATHIVGGDIGYKHLESDNYQIYLDLYIDCVNGAQGAIDQDLKAIFTFFNATDGSFIETIEIDRTEVERVEELHYKCLSNEPNACVQRFGFSFTKELDPGSDGIIISFQRCCRNKTISNLVDPESTGATFFTHIPPRNIVEDNSSARFKRLPPNFLCTNAPLIFDHSAVDDDGDSLVYELSTPFVGATYSSPRPARSSNPPFNKVMYKSPYHLNDMMGGTTLLQMNRETGELRVTPSQVGQFVVGMKVSEYRNGVKIGETYRDYQFNVIDCDLNVVANFNAPERVCERKVDFTDRSSGDQLRYQWDFGEEQINNDISSNQNTSWVYSNPGTYKVRLVVSNDGCRDTFYKFVEIVGRDSIFARFEVGPKIGCDSLTVNIVNYSDDAEWFQWNMGDGSLHAVDQDVTMYTYKEPGEYPISLLIEDSSSCNILHNAFDTVKVVESEHHEARFDINFKQDCEADGKVNITGITPNDNFTWDYGDGSTSTNEVDNPHYYSEEGNYTIKYVTQEEGLCVFNDSFEISFFVSNSKAIVDGITLYNFFSPNDDAFNNCFKVDVDRFDCVEVTFQIFNRWGELVYESNDVNGCWDGRHYKTKEELPSSEYFGIYFFDIHGRSNRLELSNVISLVR